MTVYQFRSPSARNAVYAAYETARDDIPADNRILNAANQISAMIQNGDFDALPPHTLRMLEHLPPALAEIAGNVFTLRKLAERCEVVDLRQWSTGQRGDNK